MLIECAVRKLLADGTLGEVNIGDRRLIRPPASRHSRGSTVPHERPQPNYKGHVSGTPGHYRGRVTVNGQRVDRRGKTRREVQGKLDKALEEMLTGKFKSRVKPARHLSVKTMTVGDFLDGWLAFARG